MRLTWTITKEDIGYSAKAVGEAIFTQADNWEELEKNIEEAEELHLDDFVSEFIEDNQQLFNVLD